MPGTVLLFSSTPGGAAISEPCVKERSMNPEAAPFIYRTLPHNRVCQPGRVSFPTPETETVMARLTDSIDSIVTKSSLAPLDVVKFSGNPCEYFRFKSRFEEMVDTQNISEAQKMLRLLQFLDGPARSAIAGFEGVPGGLGKGLKMLQQRFGQPHIVAKSCVDALVDGPKISNNDRQGQFADRSRTLYDTLRLLNALSEMNMSNLAKMSGKLPVVLQIKWRDEALRIRERKGFPTLEDLMMFIERRAEAANDPVFGRVGETKQFFQRRNPRASRQPLPPSLNKVRGSETTTMAVQVGHSDPAKSDKGSNSTTRKVKCYGCESTHKVEHCPDFISKSIRQRIVFARYKEHFVSECQATFKCTNCKCKNCQQPHHSLLHKPIEDKEGTLANPTEGPGPREQANVNTVATAPVETASRTYSTTSRTKVALQVVPVRIMSKKGDSVATYALLDTGSEETFLS